MRQVYLVLLALSAFLLISVPSWAGPIEKLSDLQSDMKSVRVEFRQEKHTELLPRPVKSRGTFYFKEGSGVRWEYDGQMVVIYDNKTLYLHYIELEEAEKVKGIAGFNGPLSFNVADLKKDYDIKAENSGSGDITLTLLPRSRMPFASMLMHFSKGKAFPDEVRVMEEAGDETVIRFNEPSINIKLGKGLFMFKPPKGVRVNERKYR